MAILKSVAEGSETLDLGAARSARIEARGDVKRYIKLTAGYVEVLPEIPLSAGILFKNQDIQGGLAGMLLDPTDADLILKDGLTDDDLTAIAVFMSGKSLGE